MRLRELLLLMGAFLSVALSATALSDTGSDAKSVSSSDTPLFDYRYTQVAEDLGILEDGASENKLDYGSIETANLTPMDPPKKTNACRLTIKQAGIDPIYFGVIFIINNAIGLITPPVGTTLNVICGVAKIKMDEVIVGVMPFLIAELVVLALLTLFPSLVLVPMRWFI